MLQEREAEAKQSLIDTSGEPVAHIEFTEQLSNIEDAVNNGEIKKMHLEMLHDGSVSRLAEMETGLS